MTIPVAPDSIEGEAANRRLQGADRGVEGNERLTALAGAILFGLLVVEIVTVLSLRAFMTVHLVVGAVLAGPLVVKLGSTGYRFARYYTGSVDYVRRGPPRLLLRLLAPLLVVTTIVLVGSGIGLELAGPVQPGSLFALHNVSFLVWLPIVAVHVVAYIVRTRRLVAADATEQGATPIGGRGWRLTTNGIALLLGATGALVLLPDATPWVDWSQTTQQIPAPLIVGTVLTAVALLVARPDRWANVR